MSNGRWHPPTCKVCGLGRKDGVYVTARGKCRDCAKRLVEENNDSLTAHRGEPFDYWRLRNSAALGSIPVELIPQYLDAHPELT